MENQHFSAFLAKVRNNRAWAAWYRAEPAREMSSSYPLVSFGILMKSDEKCDISLISHILRIKYRRFAWGVLEEVILGDPWVIICALWTTHEMRPFSQRGFYGRSGKK